MHLNKLLMNLLSSWPGVVFLNLSVITDDFSQTFAEWSHVFRAISFLRVSIWPRSSCLLRQHILTVPQRIFFLSREIYIVLLMLLANQDVI